MTGTTETTPAPAWARGYDVTELKEITALFKAHDAGMVLGPFGRYSEVEAANDLAAGRLHVWRTDQGDPFAAVVLETTRAVRPVRDFTGTIRLRLPKGTRVLSRMAWWPGSAIPREVTNAVDEADAVVAWQEHPGERNLLAIHAGLERPAAIKISAASECRGVYVRTDRFIAAGRPLAFEPLDVADRCGIVRLPIDVPEGLRDALIEEVSGLTYADHYSGYNQKHAWSALAARGFFDDPTRIEKPSEMNKRWKAEHEDDLTATVRDTDLMTPAVRALLDLLPTPDDDGHGGDFERVRVMRLAPGGGELTRHADITDPDAGATPGKVARLHLPLVTNDACEFATWDLDGSRHTVRMEPGGVYYLDTRKGHTAVNNGSSPRLHLVADTWVGARLHGMLRAAGEGWA